MAMKTLCYITLLLFSTLHYSQTNISIEKNDKLVYLDSSSIETKSENYKYYRIIKDYYLDTDSYEIKEYYKSGVLKTHGTSKIKDHFSKEGGVTYYYENGNQKAITFYKKGRLNGEDIQWYENGNKKLESLNIEDESKRTSKRIYNQFWDVNGVQKVINGNGFFEDQNENEYSKGEIKNGFKEGDWEGYFKKPDYSYKETYKDGKLISGISTDKNGKTHTYTKVEIAPEPKDGIMDFYKFIGANYRTPDMKGLAGKVYLTFVVDKRGKIVEPKVIRDIGYGTGKEAVRVVLLYDGFIPGEQRGQKVRCSYSLPISIQSSN